MQHLRIGWNFAPVLDTGFGGAGGACATSLVAVLQEQREEKEEERDRKMSKEREFWQTNKLCKDRTKFSSR